MSTQTTTQGRPLSAKGRRVASAVNRYVDQADSFTVKEIARLNKVSKVAVRNRVTALEKEGRVVKVGTVESQGRGRPEAVYQAVAASEVDRSNAVVQTNRRFLNKVAEMAPTERMHMVGKALVALYELQVEDEQVMLDSIHYNAQGFTKYDAPKGSYDARQYAETGELTQSQVSYWLNPVSRTKRTRIGKYSRQVDLG